MPFLSGEDMILRLNELSNPDLEETRRVELIDELGMQHSTGLAELDEIHANTETLTGKLNESRDAMAIAYNKLNASKFQGGDGHVPDPSLQESVTLSDLLSR